MHDGSIATLAEVVEVYDAGGRNVAAGPYSGDGRVNPFKRKEIDALHLTNQEKLDLVAFLQSLTDRKYLAP
jgi:cytochrome c peroxidase